MIGWWLVVTAGVGVWLMAAPAAFGFVGTPAETSMRIAGPMIVTFSVTAWWQVLRGLRWVNVVVGVWLLVAPLLVGHTVVAVWVSETAGVAVVALSPWKGDITQRFGGGWRALWRRSGQEPGSD